MSDKTPQLELANIVDLHVLLVDDDPMALKMMHALLASLGVKQVTIAVNGSDALEKLSKVKKVVDCILCDYSMEAGNGLQLLQAVRTGAIKVIRPDACFVLVTAARDAMVVDKAGKLDVNGYLVKPVTAQSLHVAISRARSRGVKLDPERYAKVVVPAT